MAESKVKALRQRKTKAEQRAASVQQILDVAEEMFSRLGFFGVTLRDVAERVGVDPALIRYYFQSKQELFDQVFERRIESSVNARNKSLDDYVAEVGDKPTVEGALLAYFNNAFDEQITGGEGMQNFGRLFAQVNNAPGYGAEKMDRFLDPVVLRLIAIIQQALPEASRQDLFWSFHFASGAYSLSLAQTGRIDRLSDQLCKSDDFEAIRDRYVTFVAAGFRAVAERGRAARQSGRADRPKGRKA